MDRHHWIFLFIIGFVFLSVVLKAFGIINLESGEILSYAFIFYGISLVFISFGNNRKGSLFLGTVVFLTGIIFFVKNHFDFNDDSLIILPSIFFILGISFLMLFLDEISHRVPLYVAGVFIFIGLAFTFFWGSPAFITFFSAVPEIIVKALPLIIIAAVLLILLKIKKE